MFFFYLNAGYAIESYYKGPGYKCSLSVSEPNFRLCYYYFFLRCKRRNVSKCPIVQYPLFPLLSGRRLFGAGGLERTGLIPAFPGGHRGCRRIRAPRSATAPSASRASWVPAGSHCSDRWPDWGRRCSPAAGRSEALDRLFGFPLATLIRSLLLASEASTAVTPRAGGPLRRLAFLDQDKEEEASGRAWHLLQVSGPEAWRSGADRPPPARSRRGLRRRSGSRTPPAVAVAVAVARAARRPGRGTSCRRGPPAHAPCTPPRRRPPESSERPAHCCPVLWGCPATGASLGTGSPERGSMAPAGGSCFQKCLRRNLEAGEKDEKGHEFVASPWGRPCRGQLGKLKTHRTRLAAAD